MSLRSMFSEIVSRLGTVDLVPSIGKDMRQQDDEKTTVKSDDIERQSRDTRPQPAWRHPATPCKAAQPPPRPQ